MRKSYRLFSVLTLAALTFGLAAQAATGGARAEDRALVMITHKPEGFRNAFWDALREGGESAAREAGYRFEYRGVEASFGGDAARAQDSEIRRAADSGAAGILVTPIDRFRLVSAVKYAVLKGVPVVAIDSALESNLVSGNVATNGYEGGLSAARKMTELLRGKGDVVVLAHPARENRATLDREQSFAAGLERFGPGVRLLSADRFGDATIEGDRTAALALIRDYPDLKGAYAVSGSGLVGFLRALEETGKAGTVILIGWDADRESLRALEEGRIHGIMQQDPESMARTGVGILVSALKGDEERKNVRIPATIISAENLALPSIRRLVGTLAPGPAKAP